MGAVLCARATAVGACARGCVRVNVQVCMRYVCM